MNTDGNILLLNFSALNITDLKSAVETEIKGKVMDINVKVSINLRGNLYFQIVQLLEPLKQAIVDHEFVIVVPCALSIAAIYIVNELEAMSGRKPFIVEVEKDDDNSSVMSSIFKIKRIRSLLLEKQVSAKRIRNGNGEATHQA